MRAPRDDSSEEVFLNLTAFIDMMLVLVIFFLATSRFHEEERDEQIRLAQTRSKLPIGTISDVMVINIDKDGHKYVDGKQRTLPELEELVRARKGSTDDLKVVLRGDTRGMLGPFFEAMEICHRLGVKSPHIAYEQGEAGGR